MPKMAAKIPVSESSILRPGGQGHEAVKSEPGANAKNHCGGAKCANAGSCNRSSKSNLTSFYNKGYE